MDAVMDFYHLNYYRLSKADSETTAGPNQVYR